MPVSFPEKERKKVKRKRKNPLENTATIQEGIPRPWGYVRGKEAKQLRNEKWLFCGNKLRCPPRRLTENVSCLGSLKRRGDPLLNFDTAKKH